MTIKTNDRGSCLSTGRLKTEEFPARKIHRRQDSESFDVLQPRHLQARRREFIDRETLTMLWILVGPELAQRKITFGPERSKI